MNHRTVFSIVAAGALSVAAITGASAAAIAASSATPHEDPGPATSLPQTPSAPASAPTPTPTSTPPFAAGTDVARPLQPGDILITEEQIRAVVYGVDDQIRQTEPYKSAPVDTANLETQITQLTMEVSCMAGKGFYYNPITRPGKLSGYTEPSAGTALWGNTGGGDAYRWQDAGCHGKAVHETGNDNNH